MTGQDRSAARTRAVALVALVSLVLLGVGLVVAVAAPVSSGAPSTAVWAIVVCLLVAVVATSLWLDRRRRERLRAWAAAAGWTYTESDPSLVARWSGAPFGQGRSRRATEVLRGLTRGRPATSFTYRWTTGSGKSRTTHTAHVVAIDLPARLPELALTPENLATRLVRVLGAQDIQFESAEFNQAWRVQARDLRFAHGVVHPRMMERLMSPDVGRVPLRIEGPSLLSWEPGATSVARLGGRLAALCDIADAIPRHVWQDHGYDPMTAARPEEQP